MQTRAQGMNKPGVREQGFRPPRAAQARVPRGRDVPGGQSRERQSCGEQSTGRPVSPAVGSCLHNQNERKVLGAWLPGRVWTDGPLPSLSCSQLWKGSWSGPQGQEREARAPGLPAPPPGHTYRHGDFGGRTASPEFLSNPQRRSGDPDPPRTLAQNKAVSSPAGEREGCLNHTSASPMLPQSVLAATPPPGSPPGLLA